MMLAISAIKFTLVEETHGFNSIGKVMTTNIFNKVNQQSIRRHDSLAGFTLVEILIAVLIFVIIGGSLYAAIHVGLDAVKHGKDNFEVFQELRICNKQIHQDIRSFFYDKSFGFPCFEGTEASFYMVCYKTGGIYKVSYGREEEVFYRSVEKLFSYPLEAETGEPPFDEASSAESETGERKILWEEAKKYHLSSALKGIKFEYFDAVENEWLNQLTADRNYPKAVKVTFLFLDDKEIERKFQTVFSIPTGKKVSISQ